MFYLSKIIKYLIFSIIFQIIIFEVIFAGSFFTVDGDRVYFTDDGILARDIWVWIDDNNDGIEELYRFDEFGHLAKNYTHYDGKITNEKGQLLYNNTTVKRMFGTKKIIINDGTEFTPNLNDDEEYLNENILISKSINKNIRKKIENGLFLGSETLPNDEEIDGVVIDNVTKVDKPSLDVVPESGIIYIKGSENKLVIGEDGTIISGKNAVNFISSSYRFEKEVKDVIIYNGDTWEIPMEMKGDKSSVKFLLNKYNYMYFEISNENHTNETYRKPLEATLSIYADGALLEEIDDFADGNPQVVELDLDDKKTLELKLTIKKGNLSERVYINNARFRKIKNED